MFGIEPTVGLRLARRLALIAMVFAPSSVAARGSDGVAYVPEPGVKGFGIRGVEGRTLAEMLSHCRQAGLDDLERERCSQLERSLHTQPGNSKGAGQPRVR